MDSLVVVDEAFSPDWDVRQRADIHLLYPLIYNKLGSHAVRAVLIGQEIRAIGRLIELGWVFEKSTLVVGSQSEIEEKEVLREVLLARCDAKKSAMRNGSTVRTPKDSILLPEAKESLIQWAL